MSRFRPGDEKPGRDQESKEPSGGELSLLSLRGVGLSKALALINAGYHSVRQVADTPLEVLERVPGLGPKTAKLVHDGALEALENPPAEPPRPTVVPHPRSQGLEPPEDEPVVSEEAAPVAEEAPAAEELPGPAASDTLETTFPEETLPEPLEEASGHPADDPAVEPSDAVVLDAPPDQAVAVQPDPIAPPDRTVAPEPEPIALTAETRSETEAPTPPPDEPPPSVAREPLPSIDAPPTLDQPDESTDSWDVHLSVHIDNELLSDLDRGLSNQYEVLPLQRVGDVLLVAAEQPLGDDQLRDLAERTGMEVRAIPSQVANFDATLRSVYDDNRLRSRGKGLGEILIDMGLLTSEQLGQALAHQMRENNPNFHPVLSIDQSLVHLVPEALGREHNVLPLYRTDDLLLLAAAEHLSEPALLAIQRATGLTPAFVIVGPGELQDAMRVCYNARQRYELRQMWLGEILISRGLVTRQQLDSCLAAQASTRKKLGQLLVESGFINEDALYPILAEKLGMEYQRFQPQDVDYQLSYLVSQRFAERNLILPLRLDYDEGVLEVAICDPTNLQVRDMLESVAEAQGAKLKLVLAGPSRLRESISYAYNFIKQMEVDLDDLEIETEADWRESAARSEITVSEDLPKMRRIVNKLLYEAVTEGASDIHIENLETRTQVRFRIDGILHERTTPINKGNIQKIISVLKIDSGLNIAERRRAQDGVFKMRIGRDRNIDFRINVHATQFGEDAVIRVLDRARNLLALADLGMAPEVQKRWESLVANPQGLILITGPTGSGKTTTLYSSLAFLNKGDKKIVTAEDPVEYHLDGITQYQVNNFIGNTFAEYTRRFLRKDPDIILVGEIRDVETAVSCIRAAMTGHLVFSTLHTNDAISVVQRLRDLSLDSSSVGEALLCVVQQRLARRNCPDCRKPYTPDQRVLREFFPDGDIPAEAHFVRGSGCTTCHGKGLMGRVGLYEFWEVKRATRQVIASGADEAELRASAIEQGLDPLVEDALRKVYAGTTTLEELRRVVPVEQIRTYSGYYRRRYDN